ncbi:MAG: hypothetical protein ACM3U2_10980 [Deltaproteobacteria bacterium]
MRRAPLIVFFLLIIAGLLPLDIAPAQLVVGAGYHPRYRRYGNGSGSYMSGMANLIRAQSQAAVNYEQARSKYIDNKQKWTQNYFRMKEERQAYEARQKERGKHSTDALTAAAKDGLPATLGPDALDPVTGRITWPDILKGPDFAPQRTRLDELFELRAKTNSGSMNVDKIHAATAEMTAKLRNRIEEIPAKHYIAGRKFLESLDYTAQNPAG